MNEIKVLKDKGILETFKKITIKELKEYVEKYICDDLEVGKKYCYNGRDNIHQIMEKNINKGLTSLFDKYKIHYTETFEFIKCYTWVLSVYGNYEDICIWENIGRYVINAQQRRNASISNSQFTLVSRPYFELYVDDDTMSIYDYIISLLDEKKKAMIGNYESENASFQKQIRDNKRKIKSLESIDLDNI